MFGKMNWLKIFLSADKIRNLRNRHFLYFDFIIFVLTPIIALALRLEGALDLPLIQSELLAIIFFFALNKLLIFSIGGMYTRMWSHASVDELLRIGLLGVFVTIGQSLIYIILCKIDNSIVTAIPRSIPIIDGILTTLFAGFLRFSVRLSERYRFKFKPLENGTTALIVGAGDAGVSIAREINSNPKVGFTPIGFVDDDPAKKGLMIANLKVLGSFNDIPKIVRSFDVKEIIIAMPKVSGKTIRDIDRICATTPAKARIIPGVAELLDGSVNISKLREIDIDDLLRREAVQLDDLSISNEIRGRRVLVTGAGGSTGSELCRQIATYGPSQLLLLGHGENSIFNISNEIARIHPEIVCSSVIADIRDRKRIAVMMKRYKPELVYHAAAHKHVHLMELNPAEAVSNNILGSMNLVELSLENDVDRFVLISTDKAVNPSSVMGASKRVAELIVQTLSNESKESFLAVRFGNVLGSRGSVVPIFRRQIATGGPITIAHPDVKRYFMTIPEAVQLVLQSGTIGEGGEIFMLDMGEPVKIVDLATDLVKLSGLEIHKDIEVVFTGLRAGEKLFEELVLDDEHFERTKHNKIFVLRNGKLSPQKPHPSNIRNYADLRREIELLEKYAIKADAEEIRRGLKRIVPEFQYQIPTSPI